MCMYIMMDVSDNTKSAKSAIVSYLSDSLIKLVEPKMTARQVISKLDSTYERVSVAKQLAMKRKLLNFKLKSETSLVKHFNEFDKLITELISAGAKISEMDQATQLMQSLPPNYGGVITAIETMSIDQLGVSHVNTRLLHHEIKLRDEGRDTFRKVLYSERAIHSTKRPTFKNNKNFKKWFL